MAKNITVIGVNYFPEDSAIGLYTTQKAEALTARGHNVTVITGFPYYPAWEIKREYKTKPYLFEEEINGVRVLRNKQYVPKKPTFFKRIIHLISFTFGSFINLFKVQKRPDLIISIVPFTTSILLGLILKIRYRSKLWVHVQDFEFDIARQSGLNSKNSLLHKILMYVEKKLLNSADIASTISQGMKEILKQKSDSESFFLPNWIGNQKEIKFTTHRYLQTKKVKVLYSGNIGEKQDWEAFLKFCKQTSSKKYDITVVGDGAKKNWLLDNIKSFSHVKYFPPVPLSELSSLLRSADIHILFQKVDLMDAVMPSKVLGMMASSKPSLIIGNDSSEIKTIFNSCCPGIFFNCYSDQVIVELEKLIQDPIKMLEMGRSANDYVVTNFSKSNVLSRFLEKIDLL